MKKRKYIRYKTGRKRGGQRYWMILGSKPTGKYTQKEIEKQFVKLVAEEQKRALERAEEYKGKSYGSKWSRKLKIPKLHKIQGYSIDLPAKKRLRALRAEIKERGGGRKGARSTMRTLQMIINLNPSRKSDRIMKKDINKIWK